MRRRDRADVAPCALRHERGRRPGEAGGGRGRVACRRPARDRKAAPGPRPRVGFGRPGTDEVYAAGDRVAGGNLQLASWQWDDVVAACRGTAANRCRSGAPLSGPWSDAGPSRRGEDGGRAEDAGPVGHRAVSATLSTGRCGRAPIQGKPPDVRSAVATRRRLGRDGWAMCRRGPGRMDDEPFRSGLIGRCAATVRGSGGCRRFARPAVGPRQPGSAGARGQGAASRPRLGWVPGGGGWLRVWAGVSRGPGKCPGSETGRGAGLTVRPAVRDPMGSVATGAGSPDPERFPPEPKAEPVSTRDRRRRDRTPGPVGIWPGPRLTAVRPRSDPAPRRVGDPSRGCVCNRPDPDREGAWATPAGVDLRAWTSGKSGGNPTPAGQSSHAGETPARLRGRPCRRPAIG